MTGERDEGHDESAEPSPDGDAESAVAGESDHPIEGQVVLLTAAKASVPATELPDLLARAQAHLESRLDAYRRRFERVHEDDAETFLVPEAHWESLGETLDMGRKEWQAVRRAHEEQLLRAGRRTDRREEFETALDVREVVVIGV